MDADVIVVGGGPSGLVVANELALQGCSVLVLERREHGVLQSRAGTVLPRVLELLDYRGHAQMWLDRARDTSDEPLIPIHAWAGLSPIQWSLLGGAFPYRLVVPQSTTEELLLGIAGGVGVRIRHAETVTGLVQDESGVTVTTSAGDEQRQYTAQYVVGADGGRSAVRNLAGIGFPGREGTFTGMIADVRGDIRWPGGRGLTSNSRGWAMAFPFAEGGKVTRFNIVHAERRAAPRDEPVTLAEIRRCAEEIFGRELDIAELLWASRFDNTMRQADRLREGRVLLVGESARVHYPASGVGMNFCIQDAFNLGWKLGQVIRGGAADALLDTYEAERRPVMDLLLESVQAQLAVQFDFTEQGAALRTVLQRDLMPQPDTNRALGLQLLGLTEAYPTVEGAHPLEGRPVPEATVQTGDGRHRVASLLSHGTFVLLDLSRTDVFPSTLRSTRIVRGSLSAPPASLVGATAVLIRPDGYVQWASDDRKPDAAAAASALDRLLDRGAPERSTPKPAEAIPAW